MKAAPILAAALLLAGCSSNTPTVSQEKFEADTQTTQDPPKKQDPLYDQLHSGLFQADAAVKKLSDAVDLARDIQGKVTGDLVEPMKDMVKLLDTDGSSLQAAIGGEPPTEDQVKQAPVKYQGLRDQLIEEINKALKSIREQAGVADNLGEAGTAKIKDSAAKLDQLLNQIIDDLVGARTALGGTEPELPDTGDTNQPLPPGFSPGSAGTTTGGDTAGQGASAG